MISFTVHGIAEPKGSVTSRFVPGRGRTFSRSPKSTQNWEHLVRQVAQWYVPKDGLLQGPLAVALMFYLPKPKSKPKREKYPVTKPDVDKLARAILDGMIGIIYRDDSQVVSLNTVKLYGDPPRATVTVGPVEETGEVAGETT